MNMNRCASVLFAIFFGVSAVAGEKPRWELGVGLASLSQPDYLGSSEETVYASPFPFFVYRTPKYSVNRSGFVARLFGLDNTTLGLSFGVSLPVDSDDNTARRGMSDLDPAFEIGPSINVRIVDRDFAKLDLQLPVRFALNFRNADYEGLTASPRWVLSHRAGDIKLSLSAAALIANHKYHDRLYSVDAREVAQGRALYEASGGYSGTRFGFSLSKRTPEYLAAFYLNHTDFGDAVNRGSSLLNARSTLSLGMMVTWVFDRSKDNISIGGLDVEEL